MSTLKRIQDLLGADTVRAKLERLDLSRWLGPSFKRSDLIPD